MYNLANMYEDGNGISQNYEKAKELYERAIALNNASAMNNLAYMYEHGNGVLQDHYKAIKLYERAIALNNASAMCNLANMYRYGEGVPQNYQKAKELYEKAIETGLNKEVERQAKKRIEEIKTTLKMFDKIDNNNKISNKKQNLKVIMELIREQNLKRTKKLIRNKIPKLKN